MTKLLYYVYYAPSLSCCQCPVCMITKYLFAIALWRRCYMTKKYKEVANRLKNIRSALNLNQEQFGLLLYKKRNSVVRYESGDHEIPENVLNNMEAYLSINKHWLLTGEGNMFLECASELGARIPVIYAFLHKSKNYKEMLYKVYPDLVEEINEICSNLGIGDEIEREDRTLWESRKKENANTSVKITNLIGAGPAHEIENQHDENNIEVPNKTILLPSSLVGQCQEGFQVRGDSMFPTIKDGDYVGIDKEDNQFVNGEMYVIYSPYEGYVVKRLEEVREPRGIRVRSDNPYFNDDIIEHDKIETDLKIVARVAWLFGTRKK